MRNKRKNKPVLQPKPPDTFSGEITAAPARGDRLSELQAYLAAERAGKERRCSAAKIASNLIFYSAIVVLLLVILLLGAKSKGAQSFLGYSYFTVLTNSMRSEYAPGTLVIVKQTPPEQIQVGDDITFLAGPDTSVTHRVVEVHENHEETDMRAFTTKGIDNPQPDAEKVYAANVIGTVVFSIPVLGGILSYIAQNLWLIFVLWAAFLFFSFFLRLFMVERKKEKQPPAKKTAQS